MTIEVIEGHSVPVGEEYLADNYSSSGIYFVNNVLLAVDKTSNMVWYIGNGDLLNVIATKTPTHEPKPTEDKSGTVSEGFALKLTATVPLLSSVGFGSVVVLI